MFTSPFKLNLVLAWLWIVLGFVSGAMLGMKFQREDWLGGYASHRRRLYRLGHISFFGLAIINLLFVFTTQTAGLATTAPALHVASPALVVGAVTMPICCVVAAHRPGSRAIFGVPVISLLVGGACTLWEIIKL